MFLIITAIIFINRGFFKNASKTKIIAYTVVLCITTQGLYVLYVNQVLSGELGGSHSRNPLQNIENPYNPVYLLEYSRGYVFSSLAAISDQPVLGYGSWPEDKTGKYAYLRLSQRGKTSEIENLREGRGDLLIQSHSVLFGAWVRSGIGGFLAILYIMIIFIRSNVFMLRQPAIVESPYFPIILFFFISGTWTFLFSPLGHLRQSIPLMMTFIVVSAQKVKMYNK